MSHDSTPCSSRPLAIGGVGGSGTRVVAELAERLGVYMGPHQNKSCDNMDFPGIERFITPTAWPASPTFSDAELERFTQTMTAAFDAQTAQCSGWGWKNPPNYLFLERFAERFEGLRYVHVIRNGLDMALSGNTGQVRLFGHLFGVGYGQPTRTRSSLRYWIAANDYAIETGTRLLADRFMVVQFDELCTSPRAPIVELANFLGRDPSSSELDELVARVRVPDSLGRHRRWRYRRRFTDGDRRAVSRFGFD